MSDAAAPDRAPRRPAPADLVAGAVLAVLTAVQVLPRPSRLGRFLVGGWVDDALVLWIVRNTGASAWPPGQWFETNAFWPRRDTLFYSDLAGGLALPYGVLSRITGNQILAFNLSVALSYLLGALALYGLLRWLGAPWAAALPAALLWSWVPHRFSSLGTPQLSCVWMVVVAVWALLAAFERERVRLGLLAGAALALCWWSSAYMALLGLTLLGVLVVLELVRHRVRWAPPAKVALAAGAVFAVGALPTVPGLLALRRSGLAERTLDEIRPFAARHLESPPTLLYRTTGWFRYGVVGQGATVFPGLLLVALAIAGAVVLARRRGGADRWAGAASGLAAAAVVCALYSLGPGRGPLSVVYDGFSALPGYSSMRYPMRFQIGVALALAVAAAAAVTWAVRGRPLPLQAGACALLVALAAGELLYFTPKADLRPVLRPAPVNRLLKGLPNGPVVEVPAEHALEPFVAVPRQLRALSDGKPRVAGYSGVHTPPETVRAVGAAANLPDPAAVVALRQAGIRYVAADAGATACRSEYSKAEADALRSALEAQGIAVRTDPSGSFVADLGTARPAGIPRDFALPARAMAPCASEGNLGDRAAIDPRATDSRSFGGLFHQLALEPLPSTAGERRVRLVARNSGVLTWRPSGGEVGSVNIGALLIDAKGLVTSREFARIPLSTAPVSPGGVVELTVTVPHPPAGTVSLGFDLVAEGVGWFGDGGSPIASVAVADPRFATP